MFYYFYQVYLKTSYYLKKNEMLYLFQFKQPKKKIWTCKNIVYLSFNKI